MPVRLLNPLCLDLGIVTTVAGRVADDVIHASGHRCTPYGGRVGRVGTPQDYLLRGCLSPDTPAGCTRPQEHTRHSRMVKCLPLYTIQGLQRTVQRRMHRCSCQLEEVSSSEQTRIRCRAEAPNTLGRIGLRCPRLLRNSIMVLRPCAAIPDPYFPWVAVSPGASADRLLRRLFRGSGLPGKELSVNRKRVICGGKASLSVISVIGVPGGD